MRLHGFHCVLLRKHGRLYAHKEEEEESAESDWSAEGERAKDSGVYHTHTQQPLASHSEQDKMAPHPTA